MREYLLVLLVAAGVTHLLAGLCRSLAVRTGMLAPVRSRDVHTFPIPYLGGVAMLGGLAIGLIETFWAAYFSVEYKDVAAFSILIIVLIFMPTGLLGRPEVEKV